MAAASQMNAKWLWARRTKEGGRSTQELFGEGGAGKARGLRHAYDVAFGLDKLVEPGMPLLESNEKGVGRYVLFFFHCCIYCLSLCPAKFSIFFIISLSLFFFASSWNLQNAHSALGHIKRWRTPSGATLACRRACCGCWGSPGR